MKGLGIDEPADAVLLELGERAHGPVIGHPSVIVLDRVPDGETIAGTINMLCSDRYTDIGEGAMDHSTWLDI